MNDYFVNITKELEMEKDKEVHFGNLARLEEILETFCKYCTLKIKTIFK